MTVALPVLSSAVMVAFVALLVRRWLGRRRPYLLLWAVGLGMFALGSLAEVYSTFAWNPWVFRGWYLFGAALNAAWIGQGTVYLLARPRFARGSLVALALLSLVALYGVASLPLDAGAFSPQRPLSVQYQEIMPPGAWVRMMTPVFNIYGLVALVGGALYSAWLFWRKRALPQRMWGNILIAVGALSIGLASSLARLGSGQFLYLGELVAAVMMFSGFLLASRRAPEARAVEAPGAASQPG